jgi:hypothetical protein
MNKNKSISAALALVASLLLSTSASAKEHKPKMADDQAKVIAHITFAGQTPLNMTMQKQGDDKYFLYIQQNNEGISVVDVAKPTRPKTVAAITDPSLANAVNVSGNLAISLQSEMPAMSNDNAKNDLIFWDLSNPTAPRVVQKFSGVVKWLQDERNFIYVLNNDGLWVISQAEERRQPDPMEIPLYQ